MSYRCLTRGMPNHEKKLFLHTYLGYFAKAAKQFDKFHGQESKYRYERNAKLFYYQLLPFSEKLDST